MILSKDEAVAILATACLVSGHVTVRMSDAKTPESTQVDCWPGGHVTVWRRFAHETERSEQYLTREDMAAAYEVIL